ncbi:type II toxin-antitoxin system RelE/ParE family toxin [Nostoc sp.]|uniref:type II toxin-antitoxin system RelE/ParE family toxin n=1 Tax=Nostoc sp. TaxID=1180 RepID=UPI002FF60B98
MSYFHLLPTFHNLIIYNYKFPEAGERFFSEFNRKCQQIVAFPNSGKSYAKIRPDLRGVSLQGYIVFYKVLDDGIEILRVVSGRRNFPSLFEESS